MNWLHTATIVFHVLIAAAIVGLVLLQRGKGADAGAGFGAGASGTVFGARGSASFLSRMTATLAALFFATSLTLAYLGGRKPEAPKSVIDRVGVPAAPVQDAPPAPTTQQAPADAAGRSAGAAAAILRRASRRNSDSGWYRGPICDFGQCGCGGTGRHASLRGWWSNPCRFESDQPHQNRRAAPDPTPATIRARRWPRIVQAGTDASRLKCCRTTFPS